ncbi:MAG: histidinol-phosphate transaminase [Rhodospirillaceae bacterium]|jgi:histidinol-phosphate aminotransferase|nr:histidinol-phosphate transaminase [Rhodospirillaceae bacterium]
MTAPQPKPGILGIEAYVPGRAKLAGHGRAIRLASNEGALGPSPRAIEAYRAAAEDIFRYPDGSSTHLREAIGAHFGLDPERIVCGCGSGDLLHLLAHAYAGEGDEVVHTEHGFLLYAIAARAAGATPVAAAEPDLVASVDAILERTGPRTRIVFVANPSNPTGTYLPAAELARLRDGLPEEVLLVVDAAYAEYATADDYDSGQGLVDRGANTVMARTFSKLHALAGLRLGWAYCPAPVADVLNRIRGPFNVSLPAQAAAAAALADTAFTERSRSHNARLRDAVTARLRALGLTVPDSQANFLLARFPGRDGRDAGAANAFLNARGIIVRQLGAYGLADCLRISIGTDEEMTAVLAALEAFMEDPHD